MSELAESRPGAYPKWADVFEALPLAVSVIDVDGRQLYGNRAYRDLFGLLSEDLCEVDVHHLTQPADRRWTDAYLERLSTGEVSEYVTFKRYRSRTGTEFLGRLTARALFGAGGCGGFVGTIEPLYDRDRVDDERLRRALAQSHIVHLLIDDRGRVIEASGRYRRQLGYPIEFWEGRRFLDLAADRPEVLRFARRVRAEPGVQVDGELPLLRGDGSVAHFSVHAVNLLEDPTVEGVVVTMYDIDEHKRQVLELSRRGEAAESTARARSEILATVSHELRNPLHVIAGIAELLRGESLPPRAAELAADLHHQLRGLAEVTQDLLDTARFDAGVVTLDPRPLDLYDVVDDVVRFAEASMDGRALEIRATVAPDVPRRIVADDTRLRQVLRNLVGNAVKFTPQGSIDIGLDVVDAGIRVRVADTGVGIPSDELGDLTAPFATASSGGASRGAGLGLSVCDRWVRAMGGELHIESELGQGSTFSFVLPLRVAPVAADQPQTTELPPGLRVLVVEDNLVNQQLARHQLARLGVESVVVGSGEEALEQLPQLDVDAVLMDLRLPGIDGLTTANMIRQLGPAHAAVPIIGVTASGTANDRARFVAAGFDYFLPKPATMADLRETLTEALRQAPADLARPATAGDHGHFSIDLAVIAALVDDVGDRAIVDSLITTFLGELPAREDRLRVGLAEGRADEVISVAHMLKAGARLFGARRLAELCEQVERTGHGDARALATEVESVRRGLLSFQRSTQ